jgi:hypothetical protein
MLAVPFADGSIPGAVEPPIGGPGTTFAFRVIYTPHTAPSAANAVIDGTAHSMQATKIRSVQPPGIIYEYTTTLPPGEHAVSFSFTSAGVTQVLPFNGVTYPLLVTPYEVTNETNITVPLVGANQKFEIAYSDGAGGTPALAEIDIDGKSYSLKANTSFPGIYQHVIPLKAGLHYYRFRVSDGATLGVYEGNLTPFIAPFILTGGHVSPATGGTSTPFTFSVTYKHSTGVAPKKALVYVNGVAHPMTLQSGSATTGAVYTAQMMLVAGAHQYFFLFGDGKSQNATPQGPATLTGPDVT